MDNHIEEYFSNNERQPGNELFRVDDTNSDIKSEVSEEELRLINVLKMNDSFLINKGLKPVFINYYKHFLRLKVSLDRKGRSEYVAINRKDNTDELINKFGNLSNFVTSRK